MNKLDEMIELRKTHFDLYERTGLTSVEASEGIQINSKTFFEQFEIFEVKDNDGDYPYQAECYYDDVKFFTLLTKEEYEKYVEGDNNNGKISKASSTEKIS